MSARKTPEEYILRIESRGLKFVRWDSEFKNNMSRARVRCVDGHEWVSTVSSLVNSKSGCPRCFTLVRVKPEAKYISVINSKGLTFVKWDEDFRGARTKVTVRCGENHEWSTTMRSITQGSGCPHCAGVVRPSPSERIDQINEREGVTFVRWSGDFKCNTSKAIVRCDEGHEWEASIHAIVCKKSGCIHCGDYGYNPSKRGTLYALQSTCGTMVKIGISNDHERRHAELKRTTPFDWDCVELLHGDGDVIAALEKALHHTMTAINFKTTFDGHTEWMRWDPRVHEWFEFYRKMFAE